MWLFFGSRGYRGVTGKREGCGWDGIGWDCES